MAANGDRDTTGGAPSAKSNTGDMGGDTPVRRDTVHLVGDPPSTHDKGNASDTKPLTTNRIVPDNFSKDDSPPGVSPDPTMASEVAEPAIPSQVSTPEIFFIPSAHLPNAVRSSTIQWDASAS